MGYNAFRRRRGMQYQIPKPAASWELIVETTGINQAFVVNIAAGTSVDITIDWDDGNAPVTYNTTGAKTCTYATAGTYYPKISGSIVGGNIRLGNSAATRGRLKAVGVICGITGLVKFESTFYACTSLTSVPADLFRYSNTLGNRAFYSAFWGCTGLASIPAGLFKYNTAVGDYGFNGTFNGCTGLTSLPTDLFKYNTLVANYGFKDTFYGCTGLTSVPEGLFRYNTAVGEGGFSLTFYGCNDLTLNAWIFYASGEEATRFASPVPVQNFNGCFRLSGAFGGIKGTAPALWDCTFNGTPTSSLCYYNHTADTVDNFASIPAGWK